MIMNPRVLLIAPFLLSLMTGCFVKHLDPETANFKTDKEAHEAAQLVVITIPRGYVSHTTGQTKSMSPLIEGVAHVVIKPVGFSEVVVGRIYSYVPSRSNENVLHRCAGRYADGSFVMAGDYNRTRDDGVSMTATNINGECVYIATSDEGRTMKLEPVNIKTNIIK